MRIAVVEFPRQVGRGVFGLAAGDGRLVTATRGDLARATAAVLLDEDHTDRVYELTGVEQWSVGEMVDELNRQANSSVRYHPLGDAELTDMYLQWGLPDFVAELVVDIDRHVREGKLALRTDDLRNLLGREPRSMSDAVAAALHS